MVYNVFAQTIISKVWRKKTTKTFSRGAYKKCSQTKTINSLTWRAVVRCFGAKSAAAAVANNEFAAVQFKLSAHLSVGGDGAFAFARQRKLLWKSQKCDFTVKLCSGFFSNISNNQIVYNYTCSRFFLFNIHGNGCAEMNL